MSFESNQEGKEILDLTDINTSYVREQISSSREIMAVYNRVKEELHDEGKVDEHGRSRRIDLIQRTHEILMAERMVEELGTLKYILDKASYTNLDGVNLLILSQEIKSNAYLASYYDDAKNALLKENPGITSLDRKLVIDRMIEIMREEKIKSNFVHLHNAILKASDLS